MAEVLHVFLSYSRRDEEWVRRLAAALAPTTRVWLDQSDIPVSLPWLDMVQDAIEEAFLFTICESPHWSASAPCAAEAAFADRFGTPVTRVRVGDPIDAAVAHLRREAGLLAGDVTALTELRVRARDWDRAGRPRSQLAGVRAGRPLSRVARRRGAPTPEAQAYLSASRRVRWQRAAAATVLTVLITGGVGGIRGAGRAGTSTQEELTKGTIATLELNTSMQRIRLSPYEGLDAAIAAEGEDRAFDARVASAALVDPVPDDAFDAGAPIEGLVDGDVGDDVVVRLGDGGFRARAAAAGDERTAQPVAEPPAPDPEADTGRPEVALGDGGGVLEVRAEGEVARRIALPQRAEDVVAGPDGRTVAVRLRRDVLVLDVATGGERISLRGAPDDLGDVRWSADGRHVWATAGQHAVRWTVRTSEVLVDEPETWFQAVVPAGDGRAWLVRRDGPITLVDLGTGEELDRVDPGTEVAGARGAPDGDRLALVGLDGRVVVLDLGTGETTPVELDGCRAIRPAWSADGALLLLPCLEAPAAVVDAATGRLRGRIAGPEHGWISVFATVPGSGEVLAGGSAGEVLAVDVGEGRSEVLHVAQCRRIVAALAASRGQELVVPAGDGQGTIGCHGARGPESDWSPLAVAVDGSTTVSAVAVLGAGGEAPAGYALGYTDGTVLLCSPPSCTSSLRITDVSGAVRDLAVVGDDLVVVTRAGQVARVDVAGLTLSLDALVPRAEARRARAVEVGVAPG